MRSSPRSLPHSRSQIAQPFQRRDPGHQGQQQENALDRIKPRRERKEILAVCEQAILEQRRDRKKHPARRHVVHQLELDRRPVELPHHGRHPIHPAGGGASHRRCHIRFAPLALARPCRSPCDRGLNRFFFLSCGATQPPVFDRLVQRAWQNPQCESNFRHSQALMQKLLRLGEDIRGQLRAVALGGCHKKRFGTTLSKPFNIALDRNKRHSEGLRYLRLARCAINRKLTCK